MSGSIVTIDNTNNGAAAFDVGSTNLSATNNWRAAAFTTGASTYTLTGVRLALYATTSPFTGSIKLSLWTLDGANDPLARASDEVSLSVSLTTSATYFAFSATDLGTLANYTLAAGTSYALVLRGPVPPAGTATKVATTAAAVSTAGGFTWLGYKYWSSGISTWFASAANTALTMSMQATCFLRGTLVLTSRGEVPVERLRAGDLVATKFGGLRPIRWIGTQSFDGRFAGRGTAPIRFARDSLGVGVPSCDLWVSPGHAMLVGDVLVHAGALVNDETIVQVRMRGAIEYFHLDLGPHDCVLANGAWAESYFEDRNRDSFHNAGEFHARFRGHVPVRQATCLPIVTAAHPAIAVLREGLARESRLRHAA